MEEIFKFSYRKLKKLLVLLGESQILNKFSQSLGNVIWKGNYEKIK